MPTFANTPRGTVVSIWGKAYIRGTDGVWRPLKLGEVVMPGDELLTEQNAIVQMTDGREPVKLGELGTLERSVGALERGERDAAPAAGLTGGDGGDLQPGLRVDRIVESVTAADPLTRLGDTPLAFGVAGQSNPPELSDPARLFAPSSAIGALEAGTPVGLGLGTPIGNGDLVVTVTRLPAIGQVVRADGSPIASGATLAPADLPGLRYVPPADYDGVAPIGSFGYTVGNGTSTASGGTQISVTAVNDAPLATPGAASGAEDSPIAVSLGGTDVDGTVASVTVTSLPANGTLLLGDGVTAVTANQVLTVSQAAGLLFRPAADFHGSARVGFTVTDNGGAVSSPAAFAITVTPLNDAPVAVDDGVRTVAQAPVSFAVLANDSDVDGDPIAVTGASVNAAQGSVLVNADGTLSFTAAPGVSGPVVVTYTVADPSGATDTATLTVDVAAAPAVTVDAPALTNDSTPTITGTSNLPPGSTVTLTVTGANGATQSFTTVVQPNGSYSADVPAALAEGPYSVSASVSIGGQSASANDGGTIDTSAPTISVDAPALTNDGTPTITGMTDLPPGSTVTLTVTGANGAVQTFTATVQAGGSYSADVPAPLAEGPYTVVATGTDLAGNTGSANDSGVVDITPPTIAVDAPAIGNDTTPTLVGTTNLPVGATVTLTVTGADGAVQTFTATVQPGGSYSADVPAPLADGPYSVVASAVDAAGNPASANDSGVVDTTPPALTVDGPALTNDTTPTISGTTDLPAGAAITLTVTGANGAVQTFSATVQAGGSYSTDVPAPLAEGPYSVVARTADAAGNPATANDTGVVDATPPAITVDAPALTNDSTPTITGTTDLPPGATVTLTVTGANGTVQTFTATVQAGGTYAADVPAALVEGNFGVVARGVDAAGNAASANDSGVIDTTAPAITVDAPALTNDTTPTVTGTTDLPAGATITLTVTGGNGAVQSFTTTVQPGGTYAAEVPAALVEGNFSVVARGTDAAGNTASANDSGAIDTTPPVITVDAPSITNDTTPALTGTTDLPAGSTITLTVTGANGAVQTFTATVQAGGTYSADVPAALVQGPFTVVASGTDAAGNSASANDIGAIDTTAPTITVDAPAITNDTTPTISGTTDLPAGSTITLTVTGANGAVQTFTANVQAGGSYSADVPSALAQGPYSAVASGTDAAGNTATANDSGAIDTTPPAITVDAPALTNDATPTLNGTTDLPAGSTITLTVTGANGAVQTFTATVQAGGTYSADVPAPLAEGAYSVVASGTDAAGNSASANDTGMLDATPPTVTVDAPALTNDSTPTIVGTTNLAAGSTVSLTVTGANGATQTFSATVQAGGTYSVDVPAALVQGTFSATATATDAAGNSAGATDTGVIDTTAPAIAVDAPAITNDTTPTISGTTDLPAGATITLTVTGADGSVQTFTATVQPGGSYSADVPAPLVQGNYSVGASGTDAAGNSASAIDNGAIDTTPPLVTIDAPAITNDTTPTLTGTTDLPAGTTITLSVTGANGAVQSFTATVQAGGTYSADVPAALVEGGYSVTASGTDAAGNSASASDTGAIDLTAPTVTVDAPALTNDTTPTVTGTTDLPVGATVSLTVTGANGATQSFTATVQAGGTYSADVPAALVEGNFSVVATATDAAGNSANANDSGAIDITPPAATLAIDPVTVDNIVNAGEASGTVAITGTVGGDVRVGDTVTITVDGSAYVGLVLAGNTFSIAVPGAAVLADADRRIDGSVTTTDAAGNSATAIANRDYAVNTAPVAVVDSASVGEDAASLAGDATPDILGQDSDADGDALTVIGVALGVQPSASGNVGSGIAGTWGTLTLAADGSYSYVPAAAAQSLDAGETVSDTFTYTISDGRGGSASATITVSVVGADDPTTIAGMLTGSVQEDAVATATGALTATDPDVGARGFTAQAGTAGAYGTFAIDAAGNWTYTLANAAANVQALAAGQSATETFVVAADDGTTASITVTVAGNNDAPVVSSTNISAVEEGAPVALGLAVPTDIDTGAALTITVTGLPSIGQVQLADGTPVANGATLSAAQLAGLRYLPPADHDGVAAVGSFGYTVSDGIANVAGGTTITLATVNDPPVAGDASAGTGENAVLSASVPAASDVDGTIASYQLVSGVGAGNGTLAFNPDGSYTFDPGSDFDGLADGATRQVSFTYTATDNNGAPSNTATVTITVTGSNDAPVATVTPAAGNEDTPIAVSLTGTDVDGTIASVTVTALPASGTLFLADGITPVAAGTPLTPAQAASLVFVPAPDFNGTVDVGFTVTDNNGAVSAAATTPIVVQPVVDPAISIDDVTVNEAAGTITFTVSLDQATTSTVRVAYATSDGSATAGSDYTGGSGTLTFAPGVTTQTITLPILDDGTFEGAESFTVTLSSPVNGVIADGTGVGTIRDDGTGTGGLDNDTPLLAVGSASATEGGFAVFTVSLSNPSATPVSFAPTLASGSATVGTDTATALEWFDGSAWQPVTAAGVTIAAGATSVQVRVATVDDAYAEGSESFTLTATVTAGTTTAPGASGSGAIDDDIDTTTVTLGAPAAVAEGGTIIYTATLTHAAQSPVSVTLSNGAVISIAAGATSGIAVVAAPGEDAYLDATSISATITGASGGGFESLAVDPAPATTTVVDTVDATVVSLSATNAVPEGGTIVYTATLTNAAQTPVTVTLSTGETITIAAGDTVGTVSIAAPDDDPYLDAGSVSRTISAASGGNFESLTVNPAAAVTVIADTTDTTVLSLSATPTVAEGGTITYTATLTNAAQTPVTVTLSTGETITIAAGATSGSVDIAAPADDAFIDAGIVSRTIAGAVGGNFESRVINPTAATTTVIDTVDVTTLSLSATASVAEGGSIVYTATLTDAADTPVTVSLSNGATITIAAGATSGTVSVAAPSDDAYLDAGSVSAAITTATGGNFESLVVDPAAAVTTVTDTIDVTTATLTATPSVAEGGTITYTVSLAAPVTGSPVSVTLANGEVVTIGVGASSGTATAIAPDNVYAGGGSVTNSIASATGGNFENLAPNTAPVTTTVTDDGDVTTVSLSATASVAEGGSIVYTATLTQAADTPVSVSLSNGATITIAAGATAGTVSVAAPSDDAYLDAGSVSATITTATGGTFESLVVDPAAAVTTVTDTVDVTTVSLTATPSVAEGGSIVYTASLTHAADTAVSVTLSTGQTITIAAGATAGSVAIAAPGDDPYLDAGTVSRTISTATGGNFESLVVDPTAAVTTITDTIDVTTATLTATPIVVEGGTITYTVSLSAPVTGSPVSVTLANGQVVAIPVGASSGTVTAIAPDDVYGGGASVGNAIFAASGGNFESLVPDTAPVATSVTDDIDPTTVSLAATASMAEGGTITYTATLTNAAQTPVTVTLSSGETIVIAAGGTSGSVAIAAPGDDPYLDAGNVSRTISSATGGNFESLVVDPAAASTAVTDTIDVTTVSLSATASVAEGGSIVYTATLSNAADAPVTVTLSSGQTIAIAAGATTGSVAIAAPAEDPYLDAGSVSRTIASATGGNFESLVVDPAAATTTVTDTIDVTTVSITGDAVVAEGTTAAYTVSLTSPAQSAVTVTLAYSGTAADGSDFTGVATVAIPAGASSAALAIATINDALAEGAENFTVTIVSAAGGNFESLAISATNGAQTTTITDDDVPSLSVSSPTVVEGDFAVFTVSLTNVSTTPVVFTPALVSGSATVGTDTAAALEFFDGSAWQPVAGSVTLPAGQTSIQLRVATTDDPYAEGSETFALTATVTSGNTGNASASGTATIGDEAVAGPEDTATLALAATPSVAEGGTITYTVTSSIAAATTMTVALSNGAIVTIAAGATGGSTTVPAPADDPYVDAGSVSATISSASGGGFEAVAIDPAAAVTTITDTIDLTTATLSATPSVAEGGTITYTVSLPAPVTGSPVAVLLANGQTVSIPVGASSGSVTAIAPDDVYGGGASVSTAIVSASGGNFESLVANTAPVTTTVTDDADVTTVSLAATASAVEGGTITYTATLTRAAQTPVTVTLSNGAAITIDAGASSGSATVAAPGDDPYVDAGSVSATIAAATGGNFESLQIDPAAATTAITDDVDVTTVSLAASASVAEGGSIVYTATLTHPADTAVTVTLSNGATIAIAAGASSGTASVAAPSDDPYLDAGSVSATITSAAGGNFESLVIDPTAATTTVTDDTDATTVSLSATASVAEGGSVVYTATLTHPADTAVSLSLSNGATITIAAGATTGTVSVAAPSDDTYLDAGSVSATITTTTGGNFESLVVDPAAAVTTITDTIDVTTATLTATPSVAEGGSIVYTATLSNAAQTPVAVTLSTGETITIAAGDTTGSVSIAAPGEDPYLDAGTVSRTISTATGGNFESLVIDPAAATTTVTDTIDPTSISLSATPTVAEGGTIVYTATLSNAAQTPMAVTLSTGETITIAAGATTGSVAIAAPNEDPYLDAGSVSRTIGSTSGGNFESLAIDPAAATTTVTDTIDVTTLSITGSASVTEGASGSYTVSLTSPAQTAVTVNLTYAGTAANGADYTGVASVTIPAGASSATFDIATIDDTIDEVAAESFTVTVASATGGNFESLVVSGSANSVTTAIVDNDPAPTLTVSSPSLGEAGGFAQFTIALSGPSSQDVTVDLALANGSASGAGVDFGAGLEVSTNGGATWVSASSVTLAAGTTSVLARTPIVNDALDEANETFTLTADRTAGATSNLSAVGTATITDDDPAPTLSIGNVTVNEAAGTASFTVTLSAASGQAVSVDYATANGSAAAPGDFVAASGTLNFAAGQTSQTITVTINDDALPEGSEAFNVNLSGASNATIAVGTGVGTILDNDTPPLGRDATVTTSEDTGFTFSLAHFLMNDAEDGNDVNPSAVRIDTLPAGGTLTLGGVAVVAGQIVSAAQIATLVFTPAANGNGTAYANFDFSVRDASGQFDTAPNTITVNVTAVNDAPTIGSAAVTGTEDTTRVFAWADFATSDVDSPTGSLSITVTSLPADGALQYFNGASWVAVTLNQNIAQADIAAGRLRFVPDANESGVDGHGAGIGDQRADYAQFGFTASDGAATSVPGTMRIDIAAVADATTIGAAANTLPASVGLTRTVHLDIPNLDGTTNATTGSRTLANIEPAVEADAASSSSVITAVNAAATTPSIGNDDAMRISGFVYLQAGNTYSFSGTFEDTLTLEIGGRRIFGAAHDGSNSDDETISGAAFTPAVSGYYSVEFISYNVGGDAGFIDLSVSVNGGAAQAFNTTNFNLQPNAAALTAVPDTVGPFVAAADPNTGTNAALSVAGYYAQHGGSVVQGQPALLRTLAATFGDSADNSERHTGTLDLSAAPAGTRVFVDANGDGAPDDGRIFTTGPGTTSVVVFNEDNPALAAGGANWNLAAIVVDAPTAFTGSFNVNAISRAEEVVGGVVVSTTSASQALPVTMVAALDLAPEVGTASASVSEEGLAHALPDAVGSPDTTDAPTTSGTISIADVDLVADSITSVTLTAPTTALTSGGVPVVWTGAGTGTLTATAGATPIATLTINTAGAYTFTLLGPIDHPAGGGENALAVNFGVVASDGTHNGSGTLTINIEDDSPGTVAPITNFIAGTDTNLLIVLDVSGSMATTDGVNGQTRLASAIQSINTLLDRYDEFGQVAVRLVTFSSAAGTPATTWTTVSAAKAALASLVASGGTNYDAALAAAQTAFGTATGKLPTAQNVSYFFSDGAPTSGTEIGAADEAAWTSFLNTNLIRSFAIGLGTGVPQAPMNPISFNGQSNENTNAVVVAAFDDLDNVLAGTIQEPPAGTLSGGASFATAGSMGADGGGYVVSMTIEGTTYTFDPATNSVAFGGGPNNGSFDAATSTLTVTTAQGGRFAVDMDDGNYRYSAPDAVPASFVQTMAYTVADADGDTTSSSVTVMVDKSNTIIGTASSETLTGTALPDYIVGRDGNDVLNGLGGNDVLQGNAGNDTLNGGDGNDRLAGGAGNDALTGGLGADTFEWRLVDRGSAGTPAVDSVADFNAATPASGGDLLDLRDLLQGETTSATLDRYLDFNVVGGNTEIRISSNGAFAGGTYAAGSEDQRIVLTGVDIRAALGLGVSATDSQIISELINRGKLLTDVPAGS